MERHEILKQRFINELTERMDKEKEQIKFLMSEERRDEANLERIKMNVLDIFYKMFNVSYNYVYSNLKNENLRNCTEGENDSYKKLYLAYMYFFDKIPAPWHEKAKKDKEHNNTSGYIIEELKINTAEDIKKLFLDYYNSLC